jgi:hypothetical protein
MLALARALLCCFVGFVATPALAEATCISAEEAQLGICGSRQSGKYFKRGCGIRGGFGWRELRTDRCDTIDASSIESICGSPIDSARCRKECRADLPICPTKQASSAPECSSSLTIEGRDGQRRNAKFSLVSMCESLVWPYKETQMLLSEGVRSILREQISNFQTLIAVGTASCEGPRKAEEDRALDRAHKVSDWAINESGAAKDGWVLNFGQFKSADCASENKVATAWQRPFILIGVKEAVQGIDLREALRNALATAPNLPTAKDYSLFDQFGLLQMPKKSSVTSSLVP